MIPLLRKGNIRKHIDENHDIYYREIMDIRVMRKEQISPAMERWLVSLPETEFRTFGFLLESMEGVGLHRRSFEAENLMEVDVAIGLKDELITLIEALQKQDGTACGDKA